MDKVPYMQRGGAWDNSDLVSQKGKQAMLEKAKKEKVVFNNKVSKNVEKKAWNKTDKEYAAVSVCELIGSGLFAEERLLVDALMDADVLTQDRRPLVPPLNP